VYQSFRIQEVLANVAFNVHFIFSDVADLTKHVTSVNLPGDFLRESDCNLSEESIWVICQLGFVDAVKHQKLVLVSKFTRVHPLEQFLDLALLAWRDVFQVLKHANKRRHALTAHQVQRSITNLIDCFGVFKWVLLQTLDVGMFATHYSDDQVSNFAHIHHRVRVIPIDLQED